MKPSLLIVDDDKHTRDGLERALRARYDIRLAENADAGARFRILLPLADPRMRRLKK